MKKIRLIIELKEKSIKISSKIKDKDINKIYYFSKEEIQKSKDYLDDSYVSFLIKSINDFNKNNNIKRCSLNFIVSPVKNTVLTKELFIEGINSDIQDKELLEIVKNELEIDVDFEISDYEIKYSKLDETDLGIKLLVALLRKKTINKLMSIEKVFWSVEGIFLSSTLAYETMNSLNIYIDFAYSYTNIVFKGENFYLNEKKNYGVKNIYELALNTAISNNDVDINKKQIFLNINDLEYEAFNFEQDNFSFSQQVKNIFLDIERSIRKVEAIQKIKFTNRFVDFNLKGLNNTKEILFNDIGWNYENYSDNFLAKSLFDLNYKKTNFNFKKNRLLNVNLKPIASSIFYALFTMSLGSIILSGFFQGKLNKANKNVKELKTKQETISQRLDEKEENILNLNNIEDALIKLEESKRYRERMLNFIPKITPKNVALKEITNDDYKTIIEGYSTDYNTIGYMAINLEKYGDVYIEKMEKIDETNEEENNLYLFDNKKLNNKFRIIYADGGIDLEKLEEVLETKAQKNEKEKGDKDDDK